MKRNFELLRLLLLFYYYKSSKINYYNEIHLKYSADELHYHDNLLLDVGYIKQKEATLLKPYESVKEQVIGIPFIVTDKGEKVCKLLENDFIWNRANDIMNKIYINKCFPFEFLLNAVKVLTINRDISNNEIKEIIFEKNNLIYRNDYTVLDFIRFFYNKPKNDFVKDYFVANSCIKIIGIADYYGKNGNIKIAIDVPCNNENITVNNMSVGLFLEYLNKAIHRKNVNKYIDVLHLFTWHESIKIKAFCISEEKIYLYFTMENFKPLSPINNI